MLPKLITDTRTTRRSSRGASAPTPSGPGHRVALQLGIGQCTPCVLGVQICCELSGFPPSLNCGPRSC